jgi:hypothetical protein
MSDYEAAARQELLAWQREMLREPGLLSRAARSLQKKVNSYIPERIHEAITTVIKQMTRAVLTGAYHTTPSTVSTGTLEEREQLVRKKIDIYRRTAAAEGGITGAAGFLLGMADFPLLISIKLKLLFEVASLYGFSTQDYQERLYLLHIFQLAFSSDVRRRDVYLQMVDWNEQRARLPTSIDEFDWRTFQQEYRDYIDLAKLAQMLPLVGAPVGVVVNNRLVRKLGTTAVNAYRMRWLDEERARQTPQLGHAASSPPARIDKADGH